MHPCKAEIRLSAKCRQTGRRPLAWGLPLRNTAAQGCDTAARASETAARSAKARDMPSFRMEKAAGGRVAGIDEVGRGPLAGPVVAAAVVFPAGVPRRLRPLIDDSKKLDAGQRLAAYVALRACGAEIAVGAASVAEISRINILQASLLAMRRAVARLAAPPDLALVDGDRPPALPCPVRCVIGGDALCFSIAAASIVAKVLRDRAMARLAVRFPAYGWESNAGYATPWHRDALQRHGPTVHHRPTFGSVRQLALFLDEAEEIAPPAPRTGEPLPLHPGD